jgi:RNA polymerase-binding transcription factor DksA
MEQKNKKISFPMSVLAPLVSYLKGEEKKLKVSKKEIKKADPFIVGNRDADNSVDSDVSENVEHDRAFAMRRQVSRSIVGIRKTLTRIKLGKYGLCTGCGQLIDTDRLAINPTAEFCISCETKKEKSARR